MKAIHDTLGEVDVIDSSEGITVLIEHNGEVKEVLRRSVTPIRPLAACNAHVFRCERCGAAMESRTE